MLTWYKNLYIGNNAKEKASKIRWKVDHKKITNDIYLVTLATNSKNLLEIIGANQLLQEPLRRLCPMIIGIAEGYAEAEEIVIEIVKATYQTLGNMDVRSYLEIEREGKQE